MEDFGQFRLSEVVGVLRLAEGGDGGSERAQGRVDVSRLQEARSPGCGF